MKNWKLSVRLHPEHASFSDFSLPEGDYLIGSGAQSDLPLPFPGVAHHHARLHLGRETAHLEPLDSSHRTFFSKAPVHGRVELAPPAVLELGEVFLRVELAAAPPDPFEKESPKASEEEPPCETLNFDLASEDQPLEETAQIQTTYQLREQIARGGMGRIFEAQETLLDREVAVKISNSALSERETAAFEWEARVLARLAHPNIVPVYGIGAQSSGLPFYSMKLVRGRTLQSILAQLRKNEPAALEAYPLERLLSFFRKVCDAVAFAHSKKILHRDLKPENIMVGEFGEVLVMDWGLALFFGGSGKEEPAFDRPDHEALAGSALRIQGTPQYMSPEQAEGKVESLDERSDIYSLGGILYAILTCQAPVEGKTVEEILAKVTRGTLRPMGPQKTQPVQTGARPLPEALRAVTFKALALRREDRYHNVGELAADIEAYQLGFATAAENAGLFRQVVLLVGRHRLASTLFLALVLGALLFSVRLARSEKAARLNEAIAKENEAKARHSEQNAIEQREAARRETAKAHIALAESAERDSDWEGMERFLTQVPEDLRGQPWHYMNRNLHSQDLTVAAPEGTSWVAVTPAKNHPGKCLALQSNGSLSLVDLKTGEITALLNFTAPKNAVWTDLAASADGTLVAAAFKESGAATEGQTGLEARRISDGSVALALKNQQWNGLRLLLHGKEALLLVSFRDRASESRGMMWDLNSGGKLWEVSKPKGFFELSADGTKAYLASPNALLESLESRSGERAPAGGTPLVMSGFNTPVLFEESTRRYYFRRAVGPKDSRILLLDPWSSVLGFEAPCKLDIVSLVRVSPETVALLGERSRTSMTVELRDSKTGELKRSIPLLDAHAADVALEPESRTLIVMNAADLRIWSDVESVPTASSKGIYLFTRTSFFGPNDAHAFTSPKAAGKNSPESFELIFDEGPESGFRAEKRAAFPIHLAPQKTRMQPMLSASSGGEKLVTCDHENVFALQWDGKTLSQKWQASPKQAKPQLLMNAAGDRVWTGSFVLDAATGATLTTLNRSGISIFARGVGIQTTYAAWTDSTRLVELAYVNAVNGKDGSKTSKPVLLLWDTTKPNHLAQADCPQGQALCASPDGRWIAEGGADMLVRIRDGSSLQIEKEFRAHDHGVTSLAWHPTLPLLVTAAEDSSVRIWSADGLRLLEEFHCSSGGQTQAFITASGKRLAVVKPHTIEWFEPRSFGQ